jgi:hypothetical protein
VPVLALSDGATLTALAGRMARSVGSGAAAEEPSEVQRMTERLGRFEQAATILDAEPAVLP